MMYSAPANTTPTDFPRVQETLCFPAFPEFHPWISCRLEVATMYPPEVTGEGKMAAQAQLISTPLPLPPPPIALPTPPPTYPGPGGRGAAGQLTLLIRRGGDRLEGEG